MAKELIVSHKTGETLHALVRNTSGLIWQTTTDTFVGYEDANKANYDVAMPETFKAGSSGGSCYIGDFPTAIVTEGSFFVQVLDSNDVEHYFGWLDWNGFEEVFIPLRNRIR